MLDAQTGPESLRELTWLDFERLLAEVFRREGYEVEHTGGYGPDGGVDLRLRRDGMTKLVQCKHWRMHKVGVKVVRELRGVVATEGVEGGVVVTSGQFSLDAEEFARASGIRLIGGDALLKNIRAVQASQAPGCDASKGEQENAAEHRAPECGSVEASPPCPLCGGATELKTARRGAFAGRPFWGCRRYPGCSGLVNRQQEP